MFDSNNEILSSLRDFIGDALSEPDISPEHILQAIKDELDELIDYHKVQGAKARRLRDGLGDTYSEEFYDHLRANEEEDVQDKLTFGNYEFNLNTDIISQPQDQYRLDFNNPPNLKDWKKNKKNKRNK